MARILIVDDCPVGRIHLQGILTSAGHHVTTAADGEAAIEAFGKNRPDLIISDLLMPTMDGYELVRQLRNDPVLAETPVIFCSAVFVEQEARALALKCGVRHFLPKGCAPQLIQKTVQAVLQDTVSVALPLPKSLGHDYQQLLTAKLIQKLKEFEELNQCLREADRRKDEFLGMLAHELRNPMAPLMNALQIMRLPYGDESTRERAREVAERQVANMARLLDDLLDVSRITRGRIHQLRQETVCLGAVLDHAVETARGLIQSCRHDLSITVPKKPLWVKGDRARLEQVLVNLLNNAAKYTRPGGRIRVQVEQIDQEVIISVQDNGMGITSEVLPHIFELFSQADRSLDRSQGGLGIGLSVVKKLLQMHGGTVTACTRLDEGSEFVVRLPLLVRGNEDVLDAKEVGRKAIEPKRVLVVDDNVDAACSLAMLLEAWGHSVCIAHDGPTGLESARRYEPHIVLLDIGLPGMSGYQVAQELRRREKPQPLLVAVTGYAQEEDRRRSRLAGFDHHLAKPVNPSVLNKLLA